jgi:hemerythrin
MTQGKSISFYILTFIEKIAKCGILNFEAEEKVLPLSRKQHRLPAYYGKRLRTFPMSLFVWKPEYSVNEAVLDAHHQQLFSILNSVYENVMNSPELDSVLPKIDQLSEYTKYHFSTEEVFMKEKKYPDIAEHIEKHREFSRTVDSLRTSYHDNDLEIAKKLIIVLGEWLLGHVLKEDMKYANL